MRKRTAIAAATVVLALAAAIYAGRDAGPQPRAGKYLLESERAGDPGVLWVMKRMNERLCGDDPKLARRIARKFEAEFGAHPVERFYAPLFGIVADGEPSPEALSERSEYFDDLLLPVVRCSVRPMGERELSAVFEYASSTGYLLAHKLLAMELARELGCAVPPSYDAAASMRGAAEKMAAEQKESYFGDLFAERAAFLQAFGFGDLVPERDFELIRSRQEDDGGWRDEYYAKGGTNPHTTALSLWALAEKAGACPFK